MDISEFQSPVPEHCSRMPGAGERQASRLQVPRPYKQPPASLLLKLIDVQLLEQTPLMENPDALGKARDFGQDVARQKDRHALFAGQFEQEFTDLDDPSRVQAVGRFI